MTRWWALLGRPSFEGLYARQDPDRSMHSASQGIGQSESGAFECTQPKRGRLSPSKFSSSPETASPRNTATMTSTVALPLQVTTRAATVEKIATFPLPTEFVLEAATPFLLTLSSSTGDISFHFLASDLQLKIEEAPGKISNLISDGSRSAQEKGEGREIPKAASLPILSNTEPLLATPPQIQQNAVPLFPSPAARPPPPPSPKSSTVSTGVPFLNPSAPPFRPQQSVGSSFESAGPVSRTGPAEEEDGPRLVVSASLPNMYDANNGGIVPPGRTADTPSEQVCVGPLSVYLGLVSPATTPDTIREFFQDCNVVAVNLCKKRAGYVAYALFGDQASLNRGMTYSGKMHLGLPMYVQKNLSGTPLTRVAYRKSPAPTAPALAVSQVKQHRWRTGPGGQQEPGSPTGPVPEDEPSGPLPLQPQLHPEITGGPTSDALFRLISAHPSLSNSMPLLGGPSADSLCLNMAAARPISTPSDLASTLTPSDCVPPHIPSSQPFDPMTFSSPSESPREYPMPDPPETDGIPVLMVNPSNSPDGANDCPLGKCSRVIPTHPPRLSL
ncbi:hypothetical protein PAPYR_10651 [Paratrimastix pyriformis]|uniref:RRM domain-containing protein n=1 Tax=Paratrimastix pyriformis TaxID=342808 RepID=A0ABQ8U5G7_9EUKA|nr:hypothetical protein PAPYR_10651 [Paratrimastix pyriformis]